MCVQAGRARRREEELEGAGVEAQQDAIADSVPPALEDDRSAVDELREAGVDRRLRLPLVEVRASLVERWKKLIAR